ncbi:MAG: SulP family inorganic anion transporter [Pirellulaceae bacterium]
MVHDGVGGIRAVPDGCDWITRNDCRCGQTRSIQAAIQPECNAASNRACNVASSIVGGLTIIPGIVKSTTNIIGGERTLWANFFNAIMLLIFMFVARPLINQVPLVTRSEI